MKNSINTLGASNLSEAERSFLDYYGSNPVTLEVLLDKEEFSKEIWEPCAGHNNLVNVLIERGHTVRASDIYDYGYGHEILDFLKFDGVWPHDIITNPPYCIADEIALHSLEHVTPGCKVCMLLRLQFLEGNKRYEKLFKENPPKKVYVFANRQVCSKVDDFTEPSAVAYIWLLWEKGWKGNTELFWLSTKNKEEFKPISLF